MERHGHVIPNKDGSKARCGGPAFCDVCSIELSHIDIGTSTLSDFQAILKINNPLSRRLACVVIDLLKEMSSINYESKHNGNLNRLIKDAKSLKKQIDEYT